MSKILERTIGTVTSMEFCFKKSGCLPIWQVYLRSSPDDFMGIIYYSEDERKYSGMTFCGSEAKLDDMLDKLNKVGSAKIT